MTAPTPPAPLNTKGGKFSIGDKIYSFNINMQHPLVNEVVVKGIVNNDDGIYYTGDKNLWIKEEFLYKTRKDAYRSLIQQAENEMNQPENMQK